MHALPMFRRLAAKIYELSLRKSNKRNRGACGFMNNAGVSGLSIWTQVPREFCREVVPKLMNFLRKYVLYCYSSSARELLALGHTVHNVGCSLLTGRYTPAISSGPLEDHA
jgi:hypothetical protein